jgi:hypothetical protein
MEVKNDLLNFALEVVINRFKAKELNATTEDCHQLIHHLLNAKTTKVRFTLSGSQDFWTDYNDRLEIMLEKLSVKAPNLEEFSICGSFDGVHFPSPFISVKNPFEKLHFLDFGYGKTRLWSDSDLDLLTRMAPNLVIIRVSKCSEVDIYYMLRESHLEHNRLSQKAQFVDLDKISDVR